MAQFELGAVELECAEMGRMRSRDELEADFFDQGLIARVGVEEVEERFVLEEDQIGVVIAVGELRSPATTRRTRAATAAATRVRG